MKTKWEMLRDELAEHQKAAERVQDHMKWAESAKFGTDCHRCGERLETEADYLKHFVVVDTRYSNHGVCIKKKHEQHTTEAVMRIRITCKTHRNASVIPAGDELHWLPVGDGTCGTIWNGTYELDEGDLYCTGGEGEHDFEYAIEV